MRIGLQYRVGMFVDIRVTHSVIVMSFIIVLGNRDELVGSIVIR